MPIPFNGPKLKKTLHSDECHIAYKAFRAAKDILDKVQPKCPACFERLGARKEAK